MSLSHAIAAILTNSRCPVEDLQDYLAEKDSRVTRAESARLIGIFESQVRQVLDGLAVLPDTDVELIEFARQRATSSAQKQALKQELQRRCAHRRQNNQV
jgi:DNA-binding transcriptional regulator YdaS (Cro superfamily)